MTRRPPRPTLFPYTTLFRSLDRSRFSMTPAKGKDGTAPSPSQTDRIFRPPRSEEHTSELQSLRHLVCRLLLEKKKPPADQAVRRKPHAADQLRTRPAEQQAA